MTKGVGQPDVPREGPAGVLRLALWFGLATGLGEVLLLAAKKLVRDRMLDLGPQFVWMTPLADVLVLGVPGAVLAVAAARGGRGVSLRLATAVLASVALVSLLLRFPRLHPLAALLLAAGLAVQGSRQAARRAGGFRQLVQRSTGWMVALVVALALAVNGWQAIAERRALAALPPASPGAPNVLLIVLDTVRAASLGLHGNPRPTSPELERLARAGVVFERALATAPWTLPSHGSLFTGRDAHELSADWSAPLDDVHPTLGEALRGRGYLTAGFVANLLYTTREHGLARGFDHYEDYPVSAGQLVASASLGFRLAGRNAFLRRVAGEWQTLGRKGAETVSRDFLRWLDRRRPERPFFVFLNYFDAHSPYMPPEPFATRFGVPERRENPWIEARAAWPEEEIRGEHSAYEAAVAHLDHELGLLLGELRRRRALENTLLIVTSDHGEEFREHGVMEHGHSLYRPALHVPLVVVFPPRVPAGTRAAAPVSLRDIPATVTDLLELAGPLAFPGRSLARHWEPPGGAAAGPQAGRSRATPDTLLAEVRFAPRQPAWYPISRGDMQSLLDGRWRYIRNGDGREELYDFEEDPLEARDLAATPAGRDRLAKLRAALERIRGELPVVGPRRPRRRGRAAPPGSRGRRARPRLGRAPASVHLPGDDAAGRAATVRTGPLRRCRLESAAARGLAPAERR